MTQSLSNAHPLGCHHVATSRSGPGRIAASAGFGGEVKVWRLTDAGDWVLHWTLPSASTTTTSAAAAAAGGGASRGTKGGDDAWALALSADEQYLAVTTHDGRVAVWDLVAQAKAQVYEPVAGAGGGSFGLAVDLSADGRFTASGHQDGSVYVFNNVTGRLMYSLSGTPLPLLCSTARYTLRGAVE